MKFERRRPRWPLMAGMILLLALSVAAPWSWRRLHAPSGAGKDVAGPTSTAVADAAAPAIQPGEASADDFTWPSAEPEQRDPAPVLPPLVQELDLPDPARAEREAEGGGATSRGGSSAVAYDEYDGYQVVEEPLRDAGPATLPAFEIVPPSASSSPSAWSGGLASPAGPLPAAPAATPEPRLQLEDLQRVGDALWSLLARARAWELPAAADPSTAASPLSPATLSPATQGADPAAASAPRVWVNNSRERLAMAPLRRPFDAGRIASGGGGSAATTTDDRRSPTPEQAAAAAARLRELAARAEPLRELVERDLPLLLAKRPPVPGAHEAEASPGPRLVVADSLRRQVELAASYAPSAAWAVETEALLAAVASSGDGARALTAVDRLEALADAGMQAAMELPDPESQRVWLRACRGVQRRLTLWRSLLDPEQVRLAAAGGALPDELFRLQLHDLAAQTAGSDAGRTWQRFLRLEDLAGLSSAGAVGREAEFRGVARDVAGRLARARLTDEQRSFLATSPLPAFREGLRRASGGPVALERLAEIVERYESTGSRRDADSLAEACRRLGASADDRLQRLGAELDRNYRNANVRLALTDELLNRLIPTQPTTVTPVQERFGGADVRGRSQTRSELTIRLSPAVDQWKLALEARGSVQSRTYSESWPARVRNAGQLEFEVSKTILVSRDGLTAKPAESAAFGDSKLVGVDTQFDVLPLVGDWFQQVVRKRHREHQPAALAQSKQKVAERAQQRMDREVDAKLRSMEDSFASLVLEPLERLALSAEPVDMHSTEKRAVMRLRMADGDQLAAHTPRPSAPSDSLVSVQLHESALNNAAAGLRLEGQRLTVEQLHASLAGRLRGVPSQLPDDAPRKAAIEFSATDAVRVQCRGDRVRLTLSLEELSHGRDSIRRVKVHANFLPVVDGLAVRLVRDGTLEFEGPRLRTGERMALHGVFNKLIRKEEPLRLLPDALDADPRLSGLMVTQLVIDDGWVAVALGPAAEARTAWRTGTETIVR